MTVLISKSCQWYCKYQIFTTEHGVRILHSYNLKMGKITVIRLCKSDIVRLERINTIKGTVS